MREAEARRVPGRSDLAEAVARNLFKLMAIKDEYEVARLWTDGSFLRQLGQEFERWDALEVHLAPPLLAERDAATGHLKKRRFGPWMLRAMRLLARLKRLRGTAFDPFGRTAERRMERRLLARLRGAARRAAGAARRRATTRTAVELARVPEQIRGFGHVKEANVQRAKAERSRRCWSAGASEQAGAAGGRIGSAAREGPHEVLRQPAAIGVLAADRAGQARLAALDHAGLARTACAGSARQATMS